MVTPPETQWALSWLLASWGVGRYPTVSTGEQLIILSIVILNRAQLPPTSKELADITGLPQSTVSRYVSKWMNGGFVEEVIDPNDRRRRLLSLTDMALREQKSHEKEIEQFLAQLTVLGGNGPDNGIPGETLKNLLSITVRQHN